MDPFTVDTDLCIRCGACISECPTRIIGADGDGVPSPLDDFAASCLRCGHCVAACPTAAFSLDWMTPDQCPDILDELKITPRQAEQFLRSRRSIRNFKEKRVEREKLEKLLEIAGYAASAKNMQPWHWTVIQDPAEVLALAGLVVEWMRKVMEENPRMAAMAAYPQVVASWDSGVERVCRGAPHVIVAHGSRIWPFGPEDCALAISLLDLYAPTIGLGVCWGGYLYTAANNHAPLAERLGLPKNHRAFGAVMVGYPEYLYHRMPVRNEPRITWK